MQQHCQLQQILTLLVGPLATLPMLIVYGQFEQKLQEKKSHLQFGKETLNPVAIIWK